MGLYNKNISEIWLLIIVPNTIRQCQTITIIKLKSWCLKIYGTVKTNYPNDKKISNSNFNQHYLYIVRQQKNLNIDIQCIIKNSFSNRKKIVRFHN